MLFSLSRFSARSNGCDARICCRAKLVKIGTSFSRHIQLSAKKKCLQPVRFLN